MTTPTELVERYVAMWNDADPDARSAAVHELWAQDGAHILDANGSGVEALLQFDAALGGSPLRIAREVRNKGMGSAVNCSKKG